MKKLKVEETVKNTLYAYANCNNKTKILCTQKNENGCQFGTDKVYWGHVEENSSVCRDRLINNHEQYCILIMQYCS